MTEDELSYQIIGSAIEVHKELGGPGLLESIYEEALCRELTLRDIPHARQVDVPVFYKGQQLDTHFRLDLLVGNLVVVEVKAVESIIAIHLAQCLTQLRVTNRKLGLLINFGERFVKNGIERIANRL